MPSEAAELAPKMTHQRPTRCIERGGVIWAYMGPPEKQTAAAATRVGAAARQPPLRLQTHSGVQLPAGDRGRDRLEPRLDAAPLQPRRRSDARRRARQRLPQSRYRDRSSKCTTRQRADFFGAPQRRRRQRLLAHHAVHHAVVHDHPAVRRRRDRRPRLRADRRRELLGLEHQLRPDAGAARRRARRDGRRHGNSRRVRAGHVSSDGQPRQPLPDRPRRRRRTRNPSAASRASRCRTHRSRKAWARSRTTRASTWWRPTSRS